MHWFGRRLKWPWLNKSKVIEQKLWIILQINNLIKFNFALLSFAIVFYSITLSFYGADIVKNNNEYNIINPFKIIQYAENDINVFSSSEIIDFSKLDSINSPVNLNIVFDSKLVYDYYYNFSHEDRIKREWKLDNKLRKNFDLRMKFNSFTLELINFLPDYIIEKNRFNISFKMVNSYNDDDDDLYYTINSNNNLNRLVSSLNEKINSLRRKNEKIINYRYNSNNLVRVVNEIQIRESYPNEQQHYIILTDTEILNRINLGNLQREENITSLTFIELFKSLKHKTEPIRVLPEVISKIKQSNSYIDLLPDNESIFKDFNNIPIIKKNVKPLKFYYNSNEKVYETSLYLGGSKEKKYKLKIYSDNEEDFSKLNSKLIYGDKTDIFSFDYWNNSHYHFLSNKESLFKIKITSLLENIKLSIRPDNEFYEYIYEVDFYKQLPSSPAFLLLSIGYIISGLTIFLVLLFVVWIYLHLKYKNTTYRETNNSSNTKKQIIKEQISSTKLTFIENIGKKRAELLQKHKINTLEDFINSSEEDLVQILNSGKGVKLSVEKIAEMKESATKIFSKN
jgi:hypothetical protein